MSCALIMSSRVTTLIGGQHASFFIEFPEGLAVSEAPPLFVTDDKGSISKLVNYRVRDGYYVVDRLFDAAELRLGEKKQTVVRIERAS